MKIDVNMKDISTRQYLMAGVVVAFILTMVLGNYGIYTHVNHERYVVKEALMDKIECNVKNVEHVLESADQHVEFFSEWMILQLSNQQQHSIIEDVHMADMAYDDTLLRTYNSEMTGKEMDVLMIYDGYLKDMPVDLRVEMNRVFEGSSNQSFLQTTLMPSAKVILNSSYGYTAIMPYDRGIDGNDRGSIVDYYEHFNQLSTSELKEWRREVLPGSDQVYYGKTVALTGGASDRYLLTVLLPVEALVEALHTFDQNYQFHVMDETETLIINNFQTVDVENGDSSALTTVLSDTAFIEGMGYPFMKKLKNQYIVGYPIKLSQWHVLAMFDEAAIGKNTLFKTSGFYMLNLLFVGIFSFLVIMVNRHLEEIEK